MTYTIWNDEYEQAHWTPQEIAECKAKVAQIGTIIDAERSGEISHDEAMIRHLMLDPDLAENMLDDAYGNPEEIHNVQRRIKEAKRRTQEASYWNSFIHKVERTAKSGHNIDNVIAILNKAIGILKAAVQ